MIFILSTFILSIILGLLGSPQKKDFFGWYLGAQIVVEGNIKSLYDSDAQEEYRSKYYPDNGETLLLFKALPTSTFLYIPLTLFPLDTAYPIFSFGLVLLSILYIALFSKYLNLKKPILWLLVIIHPVFFANFIMGQPSILILIFLSLCYVTSKQKKFYLSGLLLSLVLLKIQFLFVAFVLAILMSNRKFWLGFLSGVFLLLTLNVIIYGPGLFIDYSRFLVLTENKTYGVSISNFYTLLNILNAIFSFLNVKNVWPSIVTNIVLFLTLTTYLHIRKPVLSQSLESRFSFAVVCGLLFGIHVFPHDLAVLFLPCVFCATGAISDNKTLLPLSLINIASVLGIVSRHLTIFAAALMVLLTFYYGKKLMKSNKRALLSVNT